MRRYSLKAKYECHLKSIALTSERKIRVLAQLFEQTSILKEEKGASDMEANFFSATATYLKVKLAIGSPAGQQYQEIKKRRNLFKRKHNRPKLVTGKRRLEYLDELNDNKFKEEIRMSKASFEKLIDMIKTHRLYQLVNGHPQKDIKLHVAVVLERLGSNGNGTGQSRLARRCGISGKKCICNDLKRKLTMI